MASYKKQAEHAYELWKRSEWDNIWKAYGNFSHHKAMAWEHCRDLMNCKYGHGLRVITKNSFVFTAGFVFEDDEGNTKFMYITPSHETVIDVA